MSYAMNSKLVQSSSKTDQNNTEQKNSQQKNMEQNNTEQNNKEQMKIVEKMQVSGYKEFRDAVEAIDKKVQLNIYFTGTKDESGVSWCPDCIQAEPLVNKAIEDFADKDSIFLVVYVGERTFWKDMQNPFRKDSDAPVSVIPTLIRWKSPARLDGDQCSKQSLLEMFFKEDVE